LYQISNNAQDIILKYKQKNGKNWEYCDYSEIKKFAWDNLYESHLLEVEAWFKGNKNKKICKVNVELDVMEKNEEFKYNIKDFLDEESLAEAGTESYRRVLQYHTYTNGYTKICSFDDKLKIDEEEKNVEDHTPELMLNVELGGMGISLI